MAKFYIVAAVFTALLYPLICFVFWGEEAAMYLFQSWLGMLQCAALGVMSIPSFWITEKVHARVPVARRPLFLRFAAPILVGIISVILLEIRVWLTGETITPLSIIVFLIFNFPGFLAAAIAYPAAAYLTKRDGPRRRRK